MRPDTCNHISVHVGRYVHPSSSPLNSTHRFQQPCWQIIAKTANGVRRHPLTSLFYFSMLELICMILCETNYWVHWKIMTNFLDSVQVWQSSMLAKFVCLCSCAYVSGYKHRKTTVVINGSCVNLGDVFGPWCCKSWIFIDTLDLDSFSFLEEKSPSLWFF